MTGVKLMIKKMNFSIDLDNILLMELFYLLFCINKITPMDSSSKRMFEVKFEFAQIINAGNQT